MRDERRAIMIAGRHSSLIPHDRPPDPQELTARYRQLHDHRLFQPRVRDSVQQDDPALFRAPFPRPCPRHVHDFVIGEALVTRDGQGPPAGFDREDASFRAGRIFGTAQGDEEERAERNPREVEPPKHAAIIRIVTRGEIEEKLIAIIRQEKTIPEDLLKLETPLAEAGIDSLDSLTILFAIEEQFGISVPDDEARAMRTLGDLVDIVERRTAR